ncbi:MAG: hypothetical protein AB4426_33555 [Xenococcaceae cyanobacterium]
MAEPSQPERIQELIAGYVLGNLSPEEAEEFQQLLTDNPELARESDRLQSVLELMPYALTQIAPPQQLRSAILENATNNDNQNVHRIKPFRLRWGSVVGTLAALLAIALGLDNYRLRHNLITVQAQLSQQQSTFTDNTSGKMAITSEVILANNWDGLSELVEDHIRSVTRSSGPVDVQLTEPTQLAKRFQPQVTLPSPLPQFVQEGSKLLGGSLCELDKTKGVRFTYEIGSGQTISFYQLPRPEKPSFPHSGSGHLYISQPQEPGIVFWEDERFLYAIVARMTPEQLKELASQIRRI